MGVYKACAEIKIDFWKLDPIERSRKDMKILRPDLKSSECLFFDSVEISDIAEYFTRLEISTNIENFQKSRFWHVF